MGAGPEVKAGWKVHCPMSSLSSRPMADPKELVQVSTDSVSKCSGIWLGRSTWWCYIRNASITIVGLIASITTQQAFWIGASSVALMVLWQLWVLVGSWARLLHPPQVGNTLSSPIAWILVPLVFKCAPLIWQTCTGYVCSLLGMPEVTALEPPLPFLPDAGNFNWPAMAFLSCICSRLAAMLHS